MIPVKEPKNHFPKIKSKNKLLKKDLLLLFFICAFISIKMIPDIKISYV